MVPEECHMHSVKNVFKTSALAAVLCAAATVALSTAASADVACNRYGDCWHVSQRYTTYPSGLNVQFYNDDWRAAHESDSQYHWRENQKDDHGYYENGEWHNFAPDHD